MDGLYKVTFNIDDVYGYVAYDEARKSISVSFPNAEVEQKIKAWLENPHEINTPDDGGTVEDFSPKRYLATESKKAFQTVLTRIWENMDVHVDWSFPPECI